MDEEQGAAIAAGYGEDMGPMTSLEAMRSTSHTVVKKTDTVNGTTVKRHSPATTTSTKKVGAHTVKHTKRG